MEQSQPGFGDLSQGENLHSLIQAIAKQAIEAYKIGKNDHIKEEQFVKLKIENKFVQLDINYLVLSNNYVQKKAGLDNIPNITNRVLSTDDINKYYCKLPNQKNSF